MFLLVVALAAAAGLAIWAYPLGDPWRHIGLEGCITLGMLVILDLGIKALLEHLEKEKKAVEDKIGSLARADWASTKAFLDKMMAAVEAGSATK